MIDDYDDYDYDWLCNLGWGGLGRWVRWNILFRITLLLDITIPGYKYVITLIIFSPYSTPLCTYVAIRQGDLLCEWLHRAAVCLNFTEAAQIFVLFFACVNFEITWDKFLVVFFHNLIWSPWSTYICMPCAVAHRKDGRLSLTCSQKWKLFFFSASTKTATHIQKEKLLSPNFFCLFKKNGMKNVCHKNVEFRPRLSWQDTLSDLN
jgi:hypothetical protein